MEESVNCRPCQLWKDILLKLITDIFRCFMNPATGTFSWIGAETTEAIFLNDFRRSPGIIPWHDLLNMLEGSTVQLPAPKCTHERNLLLDRDTPIFATAIRDIMSIKGAVINDKETEMMACRWNIFRFYRQIPQAEQIELQPCPRCFAKIVVEAQGSNCHSIYVKWTLSND